MKTYLRAGAAMSAVALTLVVPAAASAVGMSITGDDGNPLALAEGQTAQIRYMDPKMMPSFSGDEGQYSLGVTDPQGQDAGASVSCQSVTSPAAPSAIDYKGNGKYTVTLSTFPADAPSCLEPTSTHSYSFTIAAGTAVHPPASTIMSRKPNQSRALDHHFKLDTNPGAFVYDIHYNHDTTPTFGPGGDFDSDVSPFQAEGFDASGEGDLSFETPGLYTFIACARIGNCSPFSAPVKVRVMGPFDFNGVSLHANGSKYELDGAVGDGHSAVGERVKVTIAKGKGKFRALAKPKINADGDINVKFRRGPGRYRVRYAFAGSNLVAPGVWIQTLHLGRHASAEPKLVRGK